MRQSWTAGGAYTARCNVSHFPRKQQQQQHYAPTALEHLSRKLNHRGPFLVKPHHQQSGQSTFEAQAGHCREDHTPSTGRTARSVLQAATV